MGLTRDAWEEVYNHCISEPFSFMFFNNFNEKSLRIMRKFDKYITI